MSPRPGHVERDVERIDERRHPVERDPLAAAVAARCVTRISPAAVSRTTCVSGSIIGDGAGLEQRGHDADGVRAAHRVGTVRLADDEAGIACGIGRREHQVGAGLRTPAGLEAQEPADRVVDLVDVPQLLAHRRAGHVEDGAQVARALLALGVHLDRRCTTSSARTRISSWRTEPRAPGRARRGTPQPRRR